MTSLVLTVIGEDRPGLVESLAEVVAAHEGNWLESRMSRMAGKFAGIVRADVPAERAGDLAEALDALETRGLRVVVEESTVAEAAAGFKDLRLELVGNDHPGIVRDVSRALAQRGINVEELSTECTSAPMSGEPLFKATADLRIPADLCVDELRATLEELAQDLMVDITLAQV
jgi:glycine cleavage system regulatory protein